MIETNEAIIFGFECGVYKHFHVDFHVYIQTCKSKICNFHENIYNLNILQILCRKNIHYVQCSEKKTLKAKNETFQFESLPQVLKAMLLLF